MDMSSPAASRGFSQASAKAMNPRDAVTVTDCLKRPSPSDRVLDVHIKLVRQDIGHNANLSDWSIAPHLLKRFSAVF
jgi:hypothetical protein